MLALRLARGSRPLVQFRRLLVATASAGVGLLLLCTLMWAIGHPQGAVLRLVWCAIPAAAAVQLAVAVARTDPGTTPRPGLSAIGLGPARLTAYAAATTAAYRIPMTARVRMIGSAARAASGRIGMAMRMNP